MIHFSSFQLILEWTSLSERTLSNQATFHLSWVYFGEATKVSKQLLLALMLAWMALN